MSLDKPECHDEYEILNWTTFGATVSPGAVNHYFGTQNGALFSNNIFIYGINGPVDHVVKRHTVACFNGAISSMTCTWQITGVFYPSMNLVCPAGVFVLLESVELNINIPNASAIFHIGRMQWLIGPPAGTSFAMHTTIAIKVIKP